MQLLQLQAGVVTEKILFTRLSKFFEEHSVITPSQYGFRPGLSTQSALLYQKELILNNIEAKRITLGIYVDFSKAFDTINHVTLLQKLSCYGIRGVVLEFIKSYLTNRYQSVSINKELSELEKIRYGVPQGSILGPLLFIIFINDIVSIDTSAQYVIYADDTSLFFTGTNADTIIASANDTLNRLHTWTVKNSLCINCAKTKAVLFRAKSTSCKTLNSLSINNLRIEISSSAKTLGVVFHEYMSWEHHTDYIRNKLSKTVGILRKCQRILPVPQKLMLYNALFSPHLRYCHLVWATGTKNSLHNLITLQKNALRCIAGLPYTAHTSELFAKFNVLKVTTLYEYHLLTAFRSELIQKGSHIRTLANLTLNPSSRLTRHTNHWYIPRPRTNYGLQLLQYCLPSTLNKFKLTDESLRTLSKNAILIMISRTLCA